MSTFPPLCFPPVCIPSAATLSWDAPTAATSVAGVLYPSQCRSTWGGRQVAKHTDGSSRAGDWPEMKAMFKKSVSEWPSTERPLVLFLDSLDQAERLSLSLSRLLSLSHPISLSRARALSRSCSHPLSLSLSLFLYLSISPSLPHARARALSTPHPYPEPQHSWTIRMGDATSSGSRSPRSLRTSASWCPLIPSRVKTFCTRPFELCISFSTRAS